MVLSSQLPIVRILTEHLRPTLLAFGGSAGVAWLAIRGLGWTWLAVPQLPLIVAGVALSVFLGIRTHVAYGRHWEARTQWGRVVSLSRHFTHQTLSYLDEEGPGGDEAGSLAAELIERQAVYVHTLRCHCRDQDPQRDIEVQRLASTDALARLNLTANRPATLLAWHHRDLARAARLGWLTPQQLQSLDASLQALLEAQGGCERILRTPPPAAFVYLCRRLVLIYGCALPFAMLETSGWTVWVVAPAAASFFLLLEVSGALIETPFSTGSHGLPLSALSIAVERDMRHQLTDEPGLPPPVLPTGATGQILM